VIYSDTYKSIFPSEEEAKLLKAIPKRPTPPAVPSAYKGPKLFIPTVGNLITPVNSFLKHTSLDPNYPSYGAWDSRMYTDFVGEVGGRAL